MRRILYLSTASRAIGEKDLLHILDVSRQNNTRDEISGILMYGDGTFLQVLEGDPVAVERTYRRIEDDRRHRGIIKIEDVQIREREFGPWSMAFRYFERQELAAVERLRLLSADLQAEIEGSVTSSTVRGMVHTFMRNQTREMVRPQP